MSISVGATLSVGGSGGTAADGGTVNIYNHQRIVTRGADAYGILAQSIGGGGGIGGSGYHGLDWKDFGVSEETEQYLELLPIESEGDLHIMVGGSGGASGSGKLVNVENTGNIATSGAGSIAVVAQSIGGGGGLGGTEPSVKTAKSVSAVAVARAGNGGMVTVTQTGDIATSGVAAHGVLAQSIGGGGGYGGNMDSGINTLAG